jgi:Rrf2 family protein
MLPKGSEYALRAVVWLAREPGRPASADDLAEHTGIPRRYLHKVLQNLTRGRLVRSQPGPGGGYALVSRPEGLTILDVVNAVAPLERIRSCPLGLPSHSKLCPLHRELDQVYAAAEGALGRVTIAEVIQQAGQVVPLCEVDQVARMATHQSSGEEG